LPPRITARRAVRGADDEPPADSLALLVPAAASFAALVFAGAFVAGAFVAGAVLAGAFFAAAV